MTRDRRDLEGETWDEGGRYIIAYTFATNRKTPESEGGVEGRKCVKGSRRQWRGDEAMGRGLTGAAKDLLIE